MSDADAYQLEGPLTTFFSTAPGRTVVDCWSTRLASFRTIDIRAIRRRRRAEAGAAPPRLSRRPGRDAARRSACAGRGGAWSPARASTAPRVGRVATRRRLPVQRLGQAVGQAVAGDGRGCGPACARRWRRRAPRPQAVDDPVALPDAERPPAAARRSTPPPACGSGWRADRPGRRWPSPATTARGAGCSSADVTAAGRPAATRATCHRPCEPPVVLVHGWGGSFDARGPRVGLGGAARRRRTHRHPRRPPGPRHGGQAARPRGLRRPHRAHAPRCPPTAARSTPSASRWVRSRCSSWPAAQPGALRPDRRRRHRRERRARDDDAERRILAVLRGEGDPADVGSPRSSPHYANQPGQDPGRPGGLSSQRARPAARRRAAGQRCTCPCSCALGDQGLRRARRRAGRRAARRPPRVAARLSTTSPRPRSFAFLDGALGSSTPSLRDAPPGRGRPHRRRGGRARRGGLVAFPTETVYGLGADASSDAGRAAAVRRQGPPRRPPRHRAPRRGHGPRPRTGPWTTPIRRPRGRWPTACWPGPLTVLVPRGSTGWPTS